MMLMSLMGSALSVILAIDAIGDSKIEPTNPSATLSINSDGTVTYVGTGSSGASPWLSGGNTSYYVRLTVNTGTAPTSGSATATWLQLNASRSWTWSLTIIGTTSATCTVEIAADSGGATILATDTFAVTVTKDI